MYKAIILAAVGWFLASQAALAGCDGATVHSASSGKADQSVATDAATTTSSTKKDTKG